MEWLNALGPSVLVVLGGIVTWFLKARVEELRATEERLRQDRVKIYTEILAPYFEMLTDISGRGPDKAVKTITSSQYKKTAFQLALLGGDDVILAWNDFLQYVYKHSESPDTKVQLRLLGRVFLEVRRSLGNKKTKLDELDMFRWYIKDIEVLS